MGYMSALAKVKNKQPKDNSKSHKAKDEKRIEMMSKRIHCEKCKRANVTLYNKQGHYYCTNCK